MTEFFINAALSGVFGLAAELAKNAHDSETQKAIAAEAKFVADQIIQIGESRSESDE